MRCPHQSWREMHQSRNPEPLIHPPPVGIRQTGPARHIGDSLWRNQLHERWHDIDLASRRIRQQRSLMDTLTSHDEWYSVTLVRRWCLIDIIAIPMIAPDDEQAGRILFLDI